MPGRSGRIRGQVLRLRPNDASANFVDITSTPTVAGRIWTIPDRTDTSVGLADFASPPAIGNTAAAAVSATNLTATSRLILTPSTTQTLVDTATILPNAPTVAITSTSSFNLLSNPQITAGVNGQRLTVIYVGTNRVNLQDGAGLTLGRTVPMTQYSSLNLVYSTASNTWIDTSYAPYTVTQTVNSNNGSVANCAYVNTSNRPALLASLFGSITNVAVNSYVVVPWSAATVDTGAMLNTGNGQFTIPNGMGGVYYIAAGVSFNANCSGIALSIATTTLGGEIARGRLYQGNFASNLQAVAVGSAVVSLVAGTTYTIQYYYTNTGNTNYNLLSTPAGANFLTVYRLNT